MGPSVSAFHENFMFFLSGARNCYLGQTQHENLFNDLGFLIKNKNNKGTIHNRR